MSDISKLIIYFILYMPCIFGKACCTQAESFGRTGHRPANMNYMGSGSGANIERTCNNYGKI